MIRATSLLRLRQLGLAAATSALAACSSETLVFDASRIVDCSFPCDPPTPPSVWMQGQTWRTAGEALIGTNARALISADSTFPTGLSWATPVDPEDGGFSRSMQVEAVCDRPLFGRIEVLDATGDTTLQRSGPAWLFEGGLPPGCPFSDASSVNGIPTDTVVARDLFLDSR